jgi:hypothetical protein
MDVYSVLSLPTTNTTTQRNEWATSPQVGRSRSPVARQGSELLYKLHLAPIELRLSGHLVATSSQQFVSVIEVFSQIKFTFPEEG